MSSLDYESNASIDAFAERVERTLDERAPGARLWPLLGFWALNGAVYTLALRTEQHWLLAVGILLTLVWVAGFAVARDGARWFRF